MRAVVVASVLLICAHGLRAQSPGTDATAGAIDLAVGEFVASLTPHEREQFLKVRRAEGLALYNFGAGSRFRQRCFRTPPVSPVRRFYCGVDAEAYCDIDAASMDMVARAWRVVHAEGH